MPFVCTTEPYHIGQIADGGRSSKDCDTAARRLWARGEVDNNVCRYTGNGNDTAELVGTAFTARDMISVVDALGEDGMLRYWGELDTFPVRIYQQRTKFLFRVFLRHDTGCYTSCYVSRED